jgi:hypothetical protein
METYWGSEGVHASFDVGTRWRWVVSLTPRPLCPQGKVSRYPLDMRLCGPQSWSERDGEENSQPRRESNPDHPNVQSLASRYTDWAIPALNVVYSSLSLSHPTQEV